MRPPAPLAPRPEGTRRALVAAALLCAAAAALLPGGTLPEAVRLAALATHLAAFAGAAALAARLLPRKLLPWLLLPVLPGAAIWLPLGSLRTAAVYAHVAAGAVVLVWLAAGQPSRRRPYGGAALLLAVYAGNEVSRTAWTPPRYDPGACYRFLTATTPEQAGAPLFPSALRREGGDTRCAESCHPRAWREWRAHGHAAGDRPAGTRPVYRAAAAEFEARRGAAAGRWCRGCHAPDTLGAPEPAPAAGGISCAHCHGAREVHALFGSGSLTVRPAGTGGLAPYLMPRAHTRARLRSGLHGSPELCAGCHRKAWSLPQNQSRWLPGPDEYGEWQQSRYSGALFAPGERTAPRNCLGCHSAHGERKQVEPGVRVWVYARGLPPQPPSPQGLRNLTPRPPSPPGLRNLTPQPPSLRGKGESLANNTASLRKLPSLPGGGAGGGVPPAGGGGVARNLTPRPPSLRGKGESLANNTASLKKLPSPPGGGAGGGVPPAGGGVLLDIVVQNSGIGHGFPTGMADLRDAWLRVEVRDRAGRIIGVSGGARDPGDESHVYRLVALDREGQRVLHGDMDRMAAVAEHRRIPAGGADLARYRLPVRAEAVGSVTVRLLRRRRAEVFRWAREPGRPPEVLAEHTSTAPGLPEGAEGWRVYGAALAAAGAYPEAVNALQRALAAAPGDGETRLSLARTRLEEGDLLAALELFRQARAVPVAAERAAAWEGAVLRRIGQAEAAAALLAPLARRYPRDRRVRFELALARLAQLRNDEAERELRAVLDVDPLDVGAHYNLMLCLQRLNRLAEARREETVYRLLAAELAQRAPGAAPSTREARPLHVHVLEAPR